MTTLDIRQKRHQFIDKIEEKKVKAIYTLFEEEIEQGKRISTEQYNQELKEAETEYEKGKYITTEDLKKKIKKW